MIAPARAWLLLGLAGALAVWTDLLFYGVGMGINVMLWFAAIAGATVFAAARLGCAVPRDRLVVIGTAVALAGLPAFRDSGALKFFSLVAERIAATSCRQAAVSKHIWNFLPIYK